MYKKTVLGAFWYVYNYKSKIFTATLLPIAFSLLIEFVLSEVSNPFVEVVATILNLILSTLIAVTVHKIVLQGEHSVPKWGIVKWSKVEVWFFAHYAFLTFAAFIFVFLTSYIGLTVILLGILLTWVGARVSLAFPAIAIGKGVSFKYSWNITKGYSAYVISVVVLLPILAALPIVPFAYIGIPSIFLSFAGFGITIVTVSALSIAYKLITEQQIAKLS